MKERPILMSAPMVRANLAGIKTETRRIVKPQPRLGQPGDGSIISPDYFVWETKHGIIPVTPDCMYRILPLCPYGVPGDRLWVREAWRSGSSLDKRSGSEIAAMSLDAGYKKPWCPIRYEADACTVNWNPDDFGENGRYRHARFMPRWASRITDEITSVRFERLQEITEAGATAEGTQEPSLRDLGGMLKQAAWSERQVHQRLWDHINGKGHPWSANDWVWVVSFKRVTQ